MRKINSFKKCNGFGLIEVMVVIFILGLISAIAIPNFTNTNNSMNLRNASDKLKDDLGYIKNYAVTNHTSTWFTINSINNVYSYGTYDVDGNQVLLTDPTTNQSAVIDFNNFNNVTITNETLGGGFEYNFWGSPSKSGQIVLNGSRVIVIQAETGYVYEQ